MIHADGDIYEGIRDLNKANGLMIRPMDKEFIFILMVLNTKENGKKTNRMDWVKKHGQTEHAIKEIINKEKSLDMGNLSGLMALNLKETFMIIIYTVKVK